MGWAWAITAYYSLELRILQPIQPIIREQDGERNSLRIEVITGTWCCIRSKCQWLIRLVNQWLIQSYNDVRVKSEDKVLMQLCTCVWFSATLSSKAISLFILLLYDGLNRLQDVSVGPLQPVIGCYRLSHNWYLTAPPAVDLVTVEFSRSSRLAR